MCVLKKKEREEEKKRREQSSVIRGLFHYVTNKITIELAIQPLLALEKPTTPDRIVARKL